MTALNKQALREAAERSESDSWGYDRDEFNDATTPEVVLALLDELEAAEKRIAELESRTVTVKLPPRVDSSNVPFTAHTWNCCLDAVEKCIAAAGIQVIEGEG